MSETPNVSVGNFAEYLQSVVQLNELEKMTQDLDKDLADSQNVMTEIKALYNSAYNKQDNRSDALNKLLSCDDISNFLDTSMMPNVLRDVMSEDLTTVDIDHIITSIKTYVEDLKNNISVPDTQSLKPKEFVKLDVDLYVQNLDQLSRRLTDIKLNKKDELKHRNVELEDKLSQLCDDVNNFTTMIEAKSALCNSNKKLDRSDRNTLQYNNIITKLLSSINELTFMLQNKN